MSMIREQKLYAVAKNSKNNVEQHMKRIKLKPHFMNQINT